MNYRLTQLAEGKCGPRQTDYVQRWAPMLVRFSELFLGNKPQAEEVTVRAFLELLGAGAPIEFDHPPVQLLSSAFRNCRNRSVGSQRPSDVLHAAILRLPEIDRGIFILHSALSIQLPWVAAILTISHEDALQLWAKSLIEVRSSLLPTGYLKERSK